MSTIDSLHIVLNALKNDGQSNPEDDRLFSVFTYFNQWGEWSVAFVWNKREQDRYFDPKDSAIRRIDFLWSRTSGLTMLGHAFLKAVEDGKITALPFKEQLNPS